VHLCQLLLYNIIALAYEQSMNYGFSGGWHGVRNEHIMGDSLAEKQPGGMPGRDFFLEIGTGLIKK
jgi:hypothetical protein